MAYATQADMERRFGADEIDAFAAGKVDAALADATATIDAALAVRYALPLERAETPDDGGSTGDDTAIAIRAGWSVDAMADVGELTASSENTMLTIPDAAGGLHLVVWRSDAAGGDPSEIRVAAARSWRNLFGNAVPLADADGVDGQVIVTVDAQNAGLLSGETLQVL